MSARLPVLKRLHPRLTPLVWNARSLFPIKVRGCQRWCWIGLLKVIWGKNSQKLPHMCQEWHWWRISLINEDGDREPPVIPKMLNKKMHPYQLAVALVRLWCFSSPQFQLGLVPFRCFSMTVEFKYFNAGVITAPHLCEPAAIASCPTKITKTSLLR